MIGSYSQGIHDGDTGYVSGQGPLDPETGVAGAEKTERVFEKIAAILDAGGSSLDNVVKATVVMNDVNDYDAVNEVDAEYLSDPFPTRSAVEVADLPVDIAVEIEVIASV